MTAINPASALARAGVRPARARGQNFLVQGAIADRIVAAAALADAAEVVEIGPGLGILSERIVCATVGRLSLVELDARLAAQLKTRFAADHRVAVLNRDFLDTPFNDIIERPPVTIIGNLPFNAASAILERLCAYRGAIKRMVLMFQREVAERIRARPRERAYGALSVFTALYWEIPQHFRVAAGSFHPRPQVDAEVLVFEPVATSGFASAEERAVLETVRAAFSAPRKIIRNALGQALKADSVHVEAALVHAAIQPSARAETLEVTDFVRLSRALVAMLEEFREKIRDA
ncbi:MAG: 16S rRNA (adenine(1518)-N(6)/adenine(1519)-N(6))-dimethyltransferase RsmA [Candidatus Binataceae bacterium]